MNFEFEGEKIEGTQIGYVGDKNQFNEFLERNKSEIEEIITDKLEAMEIFQWDALDIEVKVTKKCSEENKYIVLLGNSFIPKETNLEKMLIRAVEGTIFCIGERDLLSY